MPISVDCLKPTKNAKASGWMSTLLACLLLTGAQEALGDPVIPGHLKAPIERWSQLCNALPSVIDRTGLLTSETVLKGLMVLQGGQLSAQLSYIAQDEACLSIAAAEATGTPTLALWSTVSPKDREQFGQSIDHLGFHYKREHLARRLADLGVDLMPGTVDSSGSSSLDATLSLTNRNRGLLLTAGHVNRSYAVVSGGQCVIALESSPIREHLKQQQPEVWSSLNATDQRLFMQADLAWEFWHEVAHCNLASAASVIANKAVAANDEVRQHSVNEQRLAAEAQECATPETSLIDQVGGTRALTAPSPIEQAMIQQGPKLTTGDSEQSDVWQEHVNRRIYRQLLEESLADRFAVVMTDLRVLNRTPGCESSASVTHPWYRMRLAWSVAEPDPKYMTWLTPWLTGTDEVVQQQVILEAFHGAIQAAKETVTPARYQEIVGDRDKRPDWYKIHDPKGVPDKQRRAAWASWLISERQQWRSQL